MSTTVFVWFLVLKTYRGVAVVPAPYATEAACRAEAARVRRPESEGGFSMETYCVRAEKAKEAP